MIAILRSLAPLSVVALAVFFVLLVAALDLLFRHWPTSWRQLTPRALANEIREWRAERALAERDDLERAAADAAHTTADALGG